MSKPRNGQVLPFTLQAPREPAGGTLVRTRRRGGGLSLTLSLDVEELAQAIAERKLEDAADETEQDDDE